MRYRIGETPDESALVALDQGVFTSMAVLSMVMGVGFVFAGMHSKHYWMATWGTGLTLSSIAYIIFVIVTT